MVVTTSPTNFGDFVIDFLFVGGDQLFSFFHHFSISVTIWYWRGG